MMKTVKIKTVSFLALITFILVSCSAIRTAPFDQYSYQKAVELKVESSRLMAIATTPYQNHSEEVNELLLDVEKMVIYEKNKPNNGISYQMWQLLADKDKNLLAGFFKRWKDKGQFSKVFLEQSKSQVEEAMSVLIQYEGKKNKESEEDLMNIIVGNQ